MSFKNKKGQAFTINDLSSIGITLVVVAVVLGLGATVLDSIQDTQTTDDYAFNATGYGLTGLNTLASYVPTIALVAVAAVVIGIILVFFGRRGSQ